MTKDQLIQAYTVLSKERALFEGMSGDARARTIKFSREMTWECAKEWIDAMEVAERCVVDRLSHPIGATIAEHIAEQ